MTITEKFHQRSAADAAVFATPIRSMNPPSNNLAVTWDSRRTNTISIIRSEPF